MEENQQKTQYVYILRCGDGTLYTGWTTDLEHRVAMHNAGKGAKYTRARRPVRLDYYEEYMDKKEALRRECAIKKMTRSEKLRLIQESEKEQDLQAAHALFGYHP